MQDSAAGSKEEHFSEQTAVIENPIESFDRYTSPVHNFFGVFFCFNLVFLGLALSLFALVQLGAPETQVYFMIISSFLLWGAVNLFLFEIWKRTKLQNTSKTSHHD